jgi:synaptobrevin family protein YKT6
MVTDEEYPVRVAFGLLNKIVDEWNQDHPKDEYEVEVTNARRSGGVKFSEIQWPQLADYLKKYQDPKQADTIMKVQQELDETKIILVGQLEVV